MGVKIIDQMCFLDKKITVEIWQAELQNSYLFWRGRLEDIPYKYVNHKIEDVVYHNDKVVFYIIF